MNQLLQYGGMSTSDKSNQPVGYPSYTHMEEIIEMYMYHNVDNHISTDIAIPIPNPNANPNPNINSIENHLHYLHTIPIAHIVLFELFPDISRNEVISCWHQVESDVLQSDMRIKSYIQSNTNNNNTTNSNNSTSNSNIMYYWRDGTENKHNTGELDGHIGDDSDDDEDKPVIYANTGLNYTM